MYKRRAPRWPREPHVRDPLDGIWWFFAFVVLAWALLELVPLLARAALR